MLDCDERVRAQRQLWEKRLGVGCIMRRGRAKLPRCGDNEVYRHTHQ